MSAKNKAWVAFLLSSLLIIGALLPIINYGYIFLYLPAFLMFGCDSATSGDNCLRILFTPFVPIALTICSLAGCKFAISRARYLTSVSVAASACAASWIVILHGFR